MSLIDFFAYVLLFVKAHGVLLRRCTHQLFKHADKMALALGRHRFAGLRHAFPVAQERGRLHHAPGGDIFIHRIAQIFFKQAAQMPLADEKMPRKRLDRQLLG